MGTSIRLMWGFEGPDLRGFFKDIFGAREKWLGSRYDIRYRETDSPIIAFDRFGGDENRLVLVNLSSQQQVFPLSQADAGQVVFGKTKVKGGKVEIGGYGYAILK